MSSVSRIRRFVQAIILSLSSLVFPILQALPEETPAQPLVQVTDLDGTTRLVGWKRAPVSYAENRIMPDGSSSSDIRVLSIQSKLTDFQAAIPEMLRVDGVTSFKLSAREKLSGETVISFMDATGMTTSEFYTWVGSAKSAEKTVKLSGFSIVTPSGPDEGTSAEVFIAPTTDFESLGGWVVPTVRYFGLKLNDPNADMKLYGTMSDEDAARQMGRFFEEWMTYITIGKNMATIGTLQTLGMQNGIDQAQDTGLQDPIFDPGN
ncbi:MAG: hypothetical protein AAFZ74_19135 [Pseudomonadota bacterium]